MWKNSLEEKSSVSPAQESSRPEIDKLPVPSSVHNGPLAGDPSWIGKGLSFTGEITGTDALLIEGSVDGKIDLPECKVTVGRHGRVTASIRARDVKVMGVVCGNVTATNLLDVCAEGSVTGDLTVARLRLEEGAYFKGSVETHINEAKLAAGAERAVVTAAPKKGVRVVRAEAGELRMEPLAQPA